MIPLLERTNSNTRLPRLHIKRYRDPSVCSSVCPSSRRAAAIGYRSARLGSRHAGCLQLSHLRPKRVSYVTADYSSPSANRLGAYRRIGSDLTRPATATAPLTTAGRGVTTDRSSCESASADRRAAVSRWRRTARNVPRDTRRRRPVAAVRRCSCWPRPPRTSPSRDRQSADHKIPASSNRGSIRKRNRLKTLAG